MLRIAITYLLGLILGLAWVASCNGETIYSVTGTTLLNADGSGAILGVSGTLIGDDASGDLVGSLTIDGFDPWRIDATAVSGSIALPPFSPAITTLLSPASSGPTLEEEAEGWTLNAIDFGRTDPFSYETLGSWDNLLAYFGTAGGSPVGANLQLVEVVEPTTGLLSLLACLFGIAVFRMR